MDKEQYDRIQNRENWEEARPKQLPRPTYWPFYLAMGLAFMGWGVKAGWLIAGAGLIIFTIALTGWITDLRHESGKIGNARKEPRRRS
ncbi:cytochrome c oxidase subunit 4 [Spirosoma rhododendri]|uniref:Cytochrome c oxidase subunit 4 n=1 Tax=Spirosoma rhododendri TaxID=2728024 RepID=A0A7L5DLP0_9BACT|nr:cytochrome c oxidase subunit 4 [Spirosoma rhododendri]QJD78442.1 cytochrome c oxidase subunit 4 [Spirosoma rhododendri]